MQRTEAEADSIATRMDGKCVRCMQIASGEEIPDMGWVRHDERCVQSQAMRVQAAAAAQSSRTQDWVQGRHSDASFLAAREQAPQDAIRKRNASVWPQQLPTVHR